MISECKIHNHSKIAMRNWKYAEIFTSVLASVDGSWKREMSFEDRDGFWPRPGRGTGGGGWLNESTP